MARGVFSNNFSQVFRELVQKSRATGHKISQYSDVDEPYIYHLIKGTKKNPSPEIVVRISLALVHLSEKITVGDIDELLKSIGHTLFRR